MSAYLRIAVAAVCTALCALALRRQNAELAMLLTVAGCCVCLAYVLELFAPVQRFLKELYAKTGLDQQLLSPLLKTLGIGLASEFGASICRDAGEQTLSGVVELAGTVLCVLVSLPLMTAVLELVQRLSGG